MILEKSVSRLIENSSILNENGDISIWNEGIVPISLINKMVEIRKIKSENYNINIKNWSVEEHASRIAYFILQKEIEPIQLIQIFNHPFYSNGDFIIHDGFHRLTSYFISNRETIPCKLIDGFTEDFTEFLN
ncbi:hypothetical protein ACOMCU_25090 [Lysinibacillus sp. UGB7]|uniref:hypothetical protein n=1 Tax=Lysinibacillus sp. UGB7 TaxID=3411039 RepID=UPI003B7621FF